MKQMTVGLRFFYQCSTLKQLFILVIFVILDVDL